MRLISGLIVLVATLLASPVTAAVDLDVGGEIPTSVAAGTSVTWRLFVGNNGPDPATDVAVTVDAPGFVPASPCGTAHLASVAPNTFAIITCTAVVPSTRGAVRVSFRATSAQPDTMPDDNLLVRTINVIDATALDVTVSAPRAVDRGLPFAYTISYRNRSPVAGTDAVIEIALPIGATYDGGPSFCTASGGNVTCRIGDIEPSAGDLRPAPSFSFYVVSPVLPTAESLSTTASIHAAQPDSGIPATAITTPLFRAFTVTNTADSGSGSLREAISGANAACTDGYPCKVAFAIAAAPAAGVQTIRPETPLPRLQGMNVVIDATTQTGYFGDSNPLGPEVQLLGDRLTSGDGLVLETSCLSRVDGLVISGFPGAAIVVLDDLCAEPFYYNLSSEGTPTLPRTIAGNYLGTDPSGLRAVPNERGIVAGGARVTPIRIERNVISGNVRSGIFLGGGRASLVTGNTIGLNALRNAALGNGASGIYIGPAAYATDVASNMIAFNHDSGVSINAAYVEIGLNSIFANDQLAIDLGLDGPTGATASLGAVTLTRAYYNPASGLTTIEGEFRGGTGIFNSILRFFANDAVAPNGYGQAQYVLGETPLPRSGGSSSAIPVVWTYPGDLRGKFVTASATARNYFGFAKPAPEYAWQEYTSATSELSRGVPVQ